MEHTQASRQKEIVSFFLKKNLLVSSDIINNLKNEDLDRLCLLISKNAPEDAAVFDSRLMDKIETDTKDTNWAELERSKALFEKGRVKEPAAPEPDAQKNKQNLPAEEDRKVNIVFSYQGESKKREIQDFVQYFNHRYKSIERLLRNRQELINTTSIKRILAKKDKEGLSFIGMVKDKAQTKNNNLVITLEDPTGQIKVLINKNKPELFNAARAAVLDEVIGVVGVNGDNIVFANNLVWPDIPTTREPRRCQDEAYAIFLSDLHVGSNNFLSEDFNKFIKWINCEAGNENQKEIAAKVKYLFIIGDLVDGCGIYPEQDKELAIKDIYEQYKECARLLKQIPCRISIIICPGNHDAMRLAEPQPPLYRDFAEPIYELKNAFLVSNPAVVNIHSSAGFPGFDVLMYHGYSFDYYVSNVDAIRSKGGYNRADIIMKFLLQRRHLSPSHTATLYIPDTESDPLVIEQIPDFFVTGHIHKSIAANYRSTTMISGSCWQSKTAFQEKVGHNPEPSRIPITNLMTRETKILKFGK